MDLRHGEKDAYHNRVYPVESATIYGGAEEKKVHSLLRVGFKAQPFLTGFI